VKRDVGILESYDGRNEKDEKTKMTGAFYYVTAMCTFLLLNF
jgi:hypothetical protein